MTSYWLLPHKEFRNSCSTRHDYRGLFQVHQTSEELVTGSSPPLSPALAQVESQPGPVSSNTSDQLEAMEISILALSWFSAPFMTPEAISVVQIVQNQQMDDPPPIIHYLAPTSFFDKAFLVMTTPPSKPSSIIDAAVAPLGQGDAASVCDSRYATVARISSLTMSSPRLRPQQATQQLPLLRQRNLWYLVHYLIRSQGHRGKATSHPMQHHRRRQKFGSHPQKMSVKDPRELKQWAATFLRARHCALCPVMIACRHNNIKLEYWTQRRRRLAFSHLPLKVAESPTTQAPRTCLCASQLSTDNRLCFSCTGVPVRKR